MYAISYSPAGLLVDVGFSYPPFPLGFSAVRVVSPTAALLSSSANEPLNIHNELIYLEQHIRFKH